MHITQDAASIARLQDRVVAIGTRNHRSSNQIYVHDVPRFPPNRPLTFTAAFR